MKPPKPEWDPKLKETDMDKFELNHRHIQYNKNKPFNPENMNSIE